MARDVNLTTSTWQATGTNVSVPQYTLTMRFDWTDDLGVSHTGTRTFTFPNVLNQLPAARVAEAMKDLLVEQARAVLGVDI